VAIFAAFVLGLLSIHPIAKAAVEVMAIVSCSSTSACTGGTNTSTGIGVQGNSTSGNGVFGQTKYVSKSGSNFKSGVVGKDQSKSGKFDAGVWGQSPRGTGLLGSSTSGFGLAGSSNSGVGVSGLSSTNTGVYGVVTGGSNTPSAVFGQDNSNNQAGGAGVVGQTLAGAGVVAVTSSTSVNSTGMVAAAPNGAFVFAGVGRGNNEVATIDGNGNLSIAGGFASSSQCANGCGNRRVTSYGATAATPTLEDTGEAQLAGGAAYVRIDPALAGAIDPRKGYVVLITPEGDTRGLYVTQRTAAGFQVREDLGGRSNVPFAYRIVAHPYGPQTARLPYTTTRKISAPRAALEATAVQPEL
jgi:hypothetical protein